MKKNYVAPVCTSYNLKIGTLCEGSLKINNQTLSGEKAAWSSGFAGGIEDDTQSSGLWDEE